MAKALYHWWKCNLLRNTCQESTSDVYGTVFLSSFDNPFYSLCDRGGWRERAGGREKNLITNSGKFISKYPNFLAKIITKSPKADQRQLKFPGKRLTLNKNHKFDRNYSRQKYWRPHLETEQSQRSEVTWWPFRIDAEFNQECIKKWRSPHTPWSNHPKSMKIKCVYLT